METKEIEKKYQQIANVLLNMIPERWEKIYLYAEIREGYRKVFFYYYPESSDKPMYSLDITDEFNIEEEEFDILENQLYNSFSELLNEFKAQAQDQWTNLTFILDNTGEMKVDYGYNDISQISPVEKQEKWEEEYLS